MSVHATMRAIVTRGQPRMTWLMPIGMITAVYGVMPIAVAATVV